MQNKTDRRGIQSVEIAYRLLHVLQSSTRALALKDIAAQAGLSSSAANNYLVSLVRTGLATPAERPGTYKLGPSSLALGVSAIQQIDAFDVLRRSVTQLRNDTGQSAAVTTWTDDGVLSLFTQDGALRSTFEIRTGLIPLIGTAAGKVFMACLPLSTTQAVAQREINEGRHANKTPSSFREEVRLELQRKRYTTFVRADFNDYASIAAPLFDINGQIRYAVSLMGTRSTLQTEKGSPHVKALLESANRTTSELGGTPPKF